MVYALLNMHLIFHTKKKIFFKETFETHRNKTPMVVFQAPCLTIGKMFWGRVDRSILRSMTDRTFTPLLTQATSLSIVQLTRLKSLVLVIYAVVY